MIVTICKVIIYRPFNKEIIHLLLRVCWWYV